MTMKGAVMEQMDGNDARKPFRFGASDRRNDSERLALIRICETDGQWKLSAALPSWDETPATVEVRPPGLLIRSGPVARWVPLPHDAFVDRAVVKVSGADLTVAMPVRGTRKRRDLVLVW